MMSTEDSGTSIANLITKGDVIKKLDLAEHEGNNRFIAGYANVAGIRDKQGDIVTMEALVGAWAKFKDDPDFALCSILHSNIPVAKVMFEPVTDTQGRIHMSGVDDKGLYIVAQIRDNVTIANDVWSKILRGDYRGYSIGGRNLNPQPEVCRDGVCTAKITDFELYEVAIVDRPANQVSLFNVLKRDDLASLAGLTNKIRNSTLTEGIVKISKKPCPDGGHYHVVINAKGELYNELSKLFKRDSMEIIEDERAGEEYVNLFNLALLRPHMGLTVEEEHGGFNSPLLPDKPKTEGKTPLNKEGDVKEDTLEESQDDSGTPETPKVEEKQEEEEAIAPLTLEVLAATLAQINQRLDAFEKRLPKEEVPKTEVVILKSEAEPVVQPTEEKAKEPTDEPEPTPEPVVVEPAPVVVEPEAEPLPVITVQSVPAPEIPVVAETTKPGVTPKEVLPVVPPTVTPEPEVESRGVNTQGIPEVGLNIGTIHEKVSWEDIRNLRNR